jgi:uncharacterized membrane protein YGL010W
MKTLIEQLSTYAAYHRDSRNIATHFLGIPMIVLAAAILLARPSMLLGGVLLSPALLLSAVAAAFYLRLDLRYGLAMSLWLALNLWLAQSLAAVSIGGWIGAGLGLFVIGWALQFLGHYHEGRKPAFVDDLIGLAVGPLFVLAEAGFAVGLRPEVRAAIESRVGAVRSATNAP